MRLEEELEEALAEYNGHIRRCPICRNSANDLELCERGIVLLDELEEIERELEEEGWDE